MAASQNEVIAAGAVWYTREFPETFDGYDAAREHAEAVFFGADVEDQQLVCEDGVASVGEFFRAHDVDYWEG